MFPGTPLDDLSPLARIMTAAAPFAGALILRVAFGGHRVLRWLVALTTFWFVLNVLLAPYSANVRQDILELPMHFR